MKKLNLMMAKASSADITAALDLSNLLQDVEKRYYPSALGAESKDAEPSETFFDEDNPKHLRAFYDRAIACQAAAPGGLFRVAFGMSVLLDPRNEIVHPALDHLELHPRFNGLAVIDDDDHPERQHPC